LAFGPEVTIGFNISAAQAGDLRFMRKFSERLKASGAGPRFMVEITEEAFVSARNFQDDVAPLLRDAGAKISIDDFGVGYSSLASLADITADELKVDRSFIVGVHRRPRSQSLIRAIESIGAALHMRVVVEGVEAAEELAFLRDSTGISVAQGFYFSKPITLPGVSAHSSSRAGEEIEAAREKPLNRSTDKSRRNDRRES
jgi:EAL domain-containing protein (putative c-di-GMP-specific phosphodiesterase class I)